MPLLGAAAITARTHALPLHGELADGPGVGFIRRDIQVIFIIRTRKKVWTPIFLGKLSAEDFGSPR